jgi:predicted TIM-barrel fold metal-dependent hydrolase
MPLWKEFAMAWILDADTHIAEPLEMWDYLDPEWAPRRPVVVEVPEDTLYGTADHMWLIDGQIFPKSAGRGGNVLVTPSSQTRFRDQPDLKARALLDLPMRFEDMKWTGVDAQVVYPTLFLAYLTSDVAYEVALTKAYNRYMADVWAKSEGRIRWVVVPPLRDIEATVTELRFGRDNGACGIFFRGIEGDRTLDDPYFFPVYEEAQKLDLAICIHQGQGAPALNNLVDIKRSGTFTHGRLPPLTAFRNIVANKIPEFFPELRFGFIETGASWIPFVLYQLSGTTTADENFWGPKLFDDYRIWVSYEVGEDLRYLIDYVGEDHLVVGTDYGHHTPGTTNRLLADISAQVNMVEVLRSRSEYSSTTIDKLLVQNPSALYGVI